jgi:hypothetical protein
VTNDFHFLMIGAMYENGGNVTHRHLDGHPELFVYPFESQLGTRYTSDPLTSTFPVKYRWPVFPLHATPGQDFDSIIDEETRVRARTPYVSKFRDHPFDLDDAARRRRYVELVGNGPRTRGRNVECFFRATFDAWRDHASSGRERIYVGYSPIVTVDVEPILADLPGAHLLHVVRNPWSAYADTKKRPVPLALEHYLLGWTICQNAALAARELHPDRVHIVRLEDLLADPATALHGVLEPMGAAPDDAVTGVSWNGTPLTEVYPWGTIRQASQEANRRTAAELDADEHAAIARLAGPFLDALGYEPDEWPPGARS